MRDIDLLQMALCLTPPWQVSASEFDPNIKRFNIRLDFLREAPLPALSAVRLK
jgi:hypothetical protein